MDWWRIAQLLFGLFFIGLLIRDGVKVIKAVRLSKQDPENPAKFLAAIRLAALFTGAFTLQLLLQIKFDLTESSAARNMAILTGIMTIVLVALYLMFRKVEGTGDYPKNRQRPPS